MIKLYAKVNFDKLKFDEKADIAMRSRNTQPVMFLNLS